MFTTLGLQPSFGFGDRLGCATPGHVAAMCEAAQGITPIFAQQSIREMQRTNRTPVEVIADARAGMRQAGWKQVSGADADHLKTIEDVDATSAAGFTFFTIDPSDDVDQDADDYDIESVRRLFRERRDTAPWFDQYPGRSVRLDSGTTIDFDELSCMRAVVKYGLAVQRALTLSTHIESVRRAHGREYEIELSVDETRQPTTLAEHYIIAEQMLKAGVRLISLAPRFPGDFEKGIDYQGDESTLRANLRDHAAIAKQLGPYKLSLHSGSDKLSIYGMLAEATEGRFHVKTAGTSYLEAVRVVAHMDTGLFREILAYSRTRYDQDRATYHVSARLDLLPDDIATSSPEQLEATYLGCWNDVPAGQGFRNLGRQILHCTFGSVLTHSSLGQQLRNLLQKHSDLYADLLRQHFAKHLEALRWQ